MKQKGITVGTYPNKKKRGNSNLSMCPTCKRCKDRTVCNNRKNCNKCSKCNKCADSKNCDKFYITVQSKAVLTIGKDPDTGKPLKKIFTANTEDEAMKELYKFKIYLEENGMPLNLKKSEKTITILGQELEDAKYRKGKIGGNAYNTNMCTLNRIKAHKFANVPIANVTREQIEKFLETERSKSNSLIKKDHSMLKRIFEYAKDNMYITKDFFAGVNVIERPKSKKADKKVEALTITEQDRFEKHLENNTVKYNDIFLLLLHTGIRVGEALALGINDVDFENNQIKVYKILTKEKDGTIVIHESSNSDTKDGTRTVDINELFEVSLKEAVDKALKNKKNKSKLLFPREDGSLTTTSSINSAFKRVCDKIEVLRKDVNTHMLRHTYATRCIEAGVTIEVLQTLMGHDKIETTINTYGHIYNYHKEKEKQKYLDYIKAERTKRNLENVSRNQN